MWHGLSFDVLLIYRLSLDLNIVFVVRVFYLEFSLKNSKKVQLLMIYMIELLQIFA